MYVCVIYVYKGCVFYMYVCVMYVYTGCVFYMYVCVIYVYTGVCFIVSPSTTVLSHRKPPSAETWRDNYLAHRNDKRDTLYTAVSTTHVSLSQSAC
jgi:ABC-type bacteriocin/lantibiotic exporter with double-glycine peptidase domain